jgi:hypothetical protein
MSSSAASTEYSEKQWCASTSFRGLRIDSVLDSFGLLVNPRTLIPMRGVRHAKIVLDQRRASGLERRWNIFNQNLFAARVMTWPKAFIWAEILGCKFNAKRANRLESL